MGLRDRLEQHWFVVLLFVVAVAVGTTWSVLNEVLVRPRDEEFARLQRRMQELEAKEQEQAHPSLPSLRQSDSSLKGKGSNDETSGATTGSGQEFLERDTANRDTSIASGSSGSAPFPVQAQDAHSNHKVAQTESPVGDSVDSRSFETESYRLAVEDMKKSGKTIRITMMLEALDESGLSFRAGRWYLLDENGERWSELKHDDAWIRRQRSGREESIGAPPALMGVHLVSGTRVKDSLVFNATGSGQGARFTLVGVESEPQSEREIIFRGLVADKN